MSENTTIDNSVIPDESTVSATGLGGAWRFANGKIRKGRQGAFEDRPSQKVVGLLRRVGIHTGKRESDGQIFSQVEADIETANGIEHFKSSLTDDNGNLKPSSATVGFTWGLNQIAKDEQVMITVSEAEFVTDKGGKPTFVNLWESPKQDWKFQQLVRPRRDKNAPKVELVDQWRMLEAEFKAHPAFSERAIREDDEAGPTHLSELCKECEAKGWPSPSQVPQVWLKRIAEKSQHPVKAKLTEYDDDVWGQIRVNLQGVTDCPDWLKAAPVQGGLSI